MRITPVQICLLLAALAFAPLAPAQDPARPAETAKAAATEQHFYRLTFVVQELGTDGKPNNSRSYTTTVMTNSPQVVQIRTDSRIPFITSAEKVSIPQFQFMNAGVNFDAHDVQELGRQLSLHVKADVTSVVPPVSQDLLQPVMRHNQWDAPVLVPIGRATPIFTSDSLDSKTAMQVVLTATPLP